MALRTNQDPQPPNGYNGESGAQPNADRSDSSQSDFTQPLYQQSDPTRTVYPQGDPTQLNYGQGDTIQGDPFTDPFADPFTDPYADPTVGYMTAGGAPQGNQEYGQYVPTQMFPTGYANQQGAGYGQPGYGQAGYGGPNGPYPPYAEPTPPPQKKRPTGLIIAIILLVVGVAVLVIALVMWFNVQAAYDANIAEYHELADANVVEDTQTGRPIVDFAALQAENSEIVGWLQIPNTPVNYPVVLHDDNDYYLDHSFLGRYDEFGAIFMDYRSRADLSDWTTVIYGHHLQNGEMFAKIADYADQAEFDSLTNIYYVTDDGQVHVLAPLCTLVVSGYDVDVLQFSFADQTTFESYLQSLIDRSSAHSSTISTYGLSHVYILSTCSYNTDNERTMLVCVDLTAANGPVLDSSQSMNEIQAAADEAAGITP